MTHPRNTGPMRAAQRCGAKTRSGQPCRAPAVNGKGRCRMHGGTKGSGAPLGNQNALRHGLYSREHLGWRREMNALLREINDTLDEI